MITRMAMTITPMTITATMGDHKPHESPLVMLVPLAVLAVGAVVAGFVFEPEFAGHAFDEFWKGALFVGEHNHILHEMHDIPAWVALAVRGMMLLGLPGVAYVYCCGAAWLPKRGRFPAALPVPAEQVVFRRALQLYLREACLRDRPPFWKGGDGAIIDGAIGPDGVAARVDDVTRDRVIKLQTGYLYHYAFAMLIGVAAIVTWLVAGVITLCSAGSSA